MSDYSFMKSGFTMTQKSDTVEMQKNVATMVATFMSEGFKHAAHYVKHHETRDVIMSEDIKRGMMLEVFLFNKRPDLSDRLDEIKQLIHGYDDDEENSDDEDSDDDMVVSDGEEKDLKYSENDCKCGICDAMNKIYDRWQAWTPETPFDIILKKNIDEIPVED